MKKKTGPDRKGMSALRRKAEAALSKSVRRTEEDGCRARKRSLESVALEGTPGKPEQCLTSVIDTTERKRFEEEIRKLNVDLARKNAELEALNKELETFSYSVSHDLKEPLRTISGFSHILLQEYAGRLDEKARNFLQHIDHASTRMGQLIDALLSLSRLTKSDQNIMEVDLTALAKEAAWEIRSRDEGRAVEIDIQEGLRATGDLYLLRAAVRNLIDNAWKFTANVTAARIEVGSDIRGGETAFFVRDNGVGFDMKYADKLFKPFQRLHSEKEYEGTGIGLTTVQRVIRMSGGRIWAEGEPGKGATFFFTLGRKEGTSSDTTCR